MASYSQFATEVRNCQVQGVITQPSRKSLGIQKVSSLFVWSSLCATSRSRATEVHGRLMRWAMFLQSYNFRVEAIKGFENVGADYLSRAEE